MTTGQMLLIVLPLMAFVLCVTVWLHLSAKRIDRMQAEESRFEVVLESRGVTEVGSAEAAPAADIQARVAKARPKKLEDGQLIRAKAAPSAETQAAAPRRKAAVVARRKTASGQTG